jgi:hypothetical protein
LSKKVVKNVGGRDNCHIEDGCFLYVYFCEDEGQSTNSVEMLPIENPEIDEAPDSD